MDVLALVISGLSLVGALVGTWLSNKRSLEALDEARKASLGTLWADAQTAVQRLLGFDPATEPLGERLQNLRIALIGLVDALPDWTGLDMWLEAERALGAALGRQVMEKAKPGDSIDERLHLLDPYQQWAQVLGSNLRRFRSVGFDADAIGKLHAHAETTTARLYAANGWAPPGTSIRPNPLP